MLRIVAVVSVVALGATAVWAQNAAGIAARKDAFKQFGGATKSVGPIAKGEALFMRAKAEDPAPKAP